MYTTVSSPLDWLEAYKKTNRSSKFKQKKRRKIKFENAINSYLWCWEFQKFNISGVKHFRSWAFQKMNISEVEHFRSWHFSSWTFQKLNISEVGISEVEHFRSWAFQKVSISEGQQLKSWTFQKLSISEVGKVKLKIKHFWTWIIQKFTVNVVNFTMPEDGYSRRWVNILEVEYSGSWVYRKLSILEISMLEVEYIGSWVY